MVPIARRNLVQDKTRLAISAGGVALAIMLVLLLNGFLTGMYRQITAYLDNTPADFYVLQKGVANFQGAGSIIPHKTLERAWAVPGVTGSAAVLAQYAILDLHHKKVTSLLVGYEPDHAGGPWRLATGRAVSNDDEVVVDRVLAKRHGLSVGDQLELLGKSFRIVGLSEGTASWMVGMIFLRHDAATRLLRADGSTSFILVSSNDGLGRLRDALPDLNVVPRATLAANDLVFLGGVFSVPLRMMVFIAVGIGALLVGLTIYSATIERAREYGVLKALGMRNGLLYGIVVRQALAAAVLGFFAGLLLITLVSAGIERVWPQFLIVVDPNALLQAAGGALAMALLASLLPARFIGRIDPAQIFRR